MRKAVLAAAAFAVLAPGAALATTGYFAHGYGIKAKATGGVGIALPQDALAPASNPAGIAWIGDRIDVGADWFTPDRGASIVGNGAGMSGNYDGNDTKSFLIPEFGYRRAISPTLAFGVAVFGNGGMNTDYKTNPFASIGGMGPAGVDLMQLFVAPTIAWKSGNHAFGASLNFAYQRFKAEGLQPFDSAPTTSSPGNVTNRGYDDSTGYNLRLGWTGKLSDALTMGATYQSKTDMSEFDKYRGLFAEQGDFDIPENYGLGIAFQAGPALQVAADVQRINYGDVASVGNSANCLFVGACQLGASNGPGFGWRNTTVYKLGVTYALGADKTLRLGYATLDQPIPASQTFFNIIAPGVVEDHLTLGLTMALSRSSELTFMYMHAFESKVNGSGSIPVGFGGGEANLRMSQDSFGIGYGVKY